MKLAAQADDSFAGYIKLHAEKAGDFIVASHGGTLALTGPDGQAVPAEEMLPLTCSGLSTAQVVELEAGEYLLRMSGFTGESAPLLFGVAGGHHHDAGDPHFWLDPVSVIKYTENIRDGLIQADPAGKELYAKNTDAYIAKLRELDAWIHRAGKLSTRASGDWISRSPLRTTACHDRS